MLTLKEEGTQTNDTTYWFGYYLTPDKKKKKIIYNPNTTNAEEAEERMDWFIKEPYIKAVFLGNLGPQNSYSFNDAVDSGFKLVEGNQNNKKVKQYSDLEKQKIFKRWYKYQQDNNTYPPEYGWQAYTDDTYTLWEDILSQEGL